jgi:hypothetical protein
MNVNRRDFLKGLTMAAAVSQKRSFAKGTGPRRIAGENLVPAEPTTAPNYWCSWSAQNYAYGHGLRELDPKILEGGSGSRLAHDALTEEIVFGKDGWARSFFPKVRRDLFLLFDDGWEAGGNATFELDSAKFPSFTGSTAERLAKLNRASEEAGWRGLAVWCRNPAIGAVGLSNERMSESSGVRYWKIDGGDPTFDLIRLRNDNQVALTLEHVNGEGPLNGDWQKDGRFGSQPWGSRRMEILRHTDVYRTYDVTSILSVPTTLDRAAEMLKGAEGHTEIRGLLNVEDEVYIAATLGCTMGVMRYPLTGLRPGKDVDLFGNGPRQPKKRMDEVVRALRWQHIAPPFTPGFGAVHVDSEALTDSWKFERGENWQEDIIGATVRQGAPARVGRNIELPEVKSNGDKPFVIAARFPNGAIAITALERTQVDRAWYMPACDVTLAVSDAPGPFGVFGHFNSLTLAFDKPIRNHRVLAQDLAGDKSIDISTQVQFEGNKLRISGEAIRHAGLQSATRGDPSAPGLVLHVS